MKIRASRKKIRETTDILHFDFPGRNEIAIEGSPPVRYESHKAYE